MNNKYPFDAVSDNRIQEERFISINGIEQWVTIKGERNKPVILFLHGGPGSPLTPYADAIYGGWEKDFVLVQWDQRGAGKTFGLTAPAELDPEYLKANSLTVDQMSNDGIVLVEYLIKYLGKQKIILFGTSWGSVLGVNMAVKRPDLFYAYVGHSQLVNPSENFVYLYNKMQQMVQKANDEKSVQVLKAIGPPPYDTARSAGQLMRVIKKYERENSTPEPEGWWKIAKEYDNEKDDQHRRDGDDYSFVNYMGDKRLHVASMMKTIQLGKTHLIFKLPVYLLQGEADILTAKEITKKYFEKISAPKKEFILIPKAAHGFNQSVVDAQYKIMKSINAS